MVHPWWFYFGAVLVQIAIWMALLLNCLVIIVVIFNKNVRQRQDLLLLNLAVSDFGFGLTAQICDYGAMFNVQQDSWICPFAAWSTTFWGHATVFSLCVLTYNRYVLIIDWKKLAVTKTVYLVVSVWVWAVIAATLFTTLFENVVHPSRLYCNLNWGSPDTASRLGTVILFLEIVAVVVLIGFFNYKIFKRVNDTTFVREMGFENRVQTQRKLAKRVIYLVIAFVIAWTPLSLVMLYNLFANAATGKQVTTPIWLDYLAVIFSVLNSATNPIIYLVMSERYRHEAWKTITCKSKMRNIGGGSTIKSYNSKGSKDTSRNFSEDSTAMSPTRSATHTMRVKGEKEVELTVNKTKVKDEDGSSSSGGVSV